MARNELAIKAGISVSALSKIEQGQSNFLITTLAKIATGLGVHVATLWPD